MICGCDLWLCFEFHHLSYCFGISRKEKRKIMNLFGAVEANDSNTSILSRFFVFVKREKNRRTSRVGDLSSLGVGFELKKKKKMRKENLFVKRRGRKKNDDKAYPGSQSGTGSTQSHQPSAPNHLRRHHHSFLL